MDPQITTAGAEVWALVRAQHGVVSRRQLRAHGYGPDAIKHRIARGRLHPKAWGVYAVGRPELTRHGELMVAVLACGDAIVSHETAAELWEIRPRRTALIELTVPRERGRDRAGVRVVSKLSA